MRDKSSNQNGYLRSQVISSVTWVVCLKYPGQILTWIITIIVIRILEPNDFGLFAEANICVGLLTLFSELGLGGFIVQRKNIDTHLLSQVLGLMIVSNIICFLLLFFGAPFISKYFSEPRLTDILRVLSIVFIFISFYFIPQSLLRRNMDFKSKSIVELIGTLCQSIICLVFALQGYGVWALVLGTISMHLVLMVGYNLASRNFVLPKIKLNGMKSIITFGGFMTGAFRFC